MKIYYFVIVLLLATVSFADAGEKSLLVGIKWSDYPETVKYKITEYLKSCSRDSKSIKTYGPLKSNHLFRMDLWDRCKIGKGLSKTTWTFIEELDIVDTTNIEVEARVAYPIDCQFIAVKATWRTFNSKLISIIAELPDSVKKRERAIKIIKMKYPSTHLSKQMRAILTEKKGNIIYYHQHNDTAIFIEDFNYYNGGIRTHYTNLVYINLPVFENHCKHTKEQIAPSLQKYLKKKKAVF